MSFFRSSNRIVIVVIILTGILTWLHVFVEAEASVSYRYGTFLFRTLGGWLANIPELFAFTGLILFLSAAFMLIFVNIRLHLIDKVPYLPALCYILLIGGVPEIHFFNPAIIATILLIAGFVVLAGSFESEKVSYRYFTVPAIISLAAFFCQYMYVYMLVVWFVIAVWRPGYWREWVFSILGFATPLFFAFSWFFLVEDDLTVICDFFHGLFNVQRIIPSLSVSVIVFFALSSVLAAIIFGYTLRHVSSKKAAIRTGYYVLVLIAVISLVIAFTVPDTVPQIWYLLSFPLSFIISCYLANVRSKRMKNIVLALLFIGVIVAHALFYQ